MSVIINEWLQDRLGIIFQDQKTFANAAKNGQILADILHNYNIIDTEELKLIKHSSEAHICLKNFDYITKWLENISLLLTKEEVEDLVNGKRSTTFSVLYKLYLLLNDKNSLNFTTTQALNQICRPQNNRFTVKIVKESTVDNRKSKGNIHTRLIDESYDVIHWHQDRLETLKKKCGAQKEEYMGYIMRTKSKKFSSNLALQSKLSEQVLKDEEEHSVASVDLDVKELMQEKIEAKEMEQFSPDPRKAKKILDSLKRKHKQQSENRILKTQLQNELLANFSEKVKELESVESDQDLCDKLMKQSLYEKQMIKKIQEVKYQKEVMMENRQIMNDAIAKEREKEFVEKLMQKDKHLDEKVFHYYLEKERALLLHRKIFDEKQRLKRERNEQLCGSIVDGIFNMAMKEVEHKITFGDTAGSRTRLQWYHNFVVGESLEDHVTPVEDIINYKEGDSQQHQAVDKEIDRQDKLLKYDLQNYLDFETPWSPLMIDSSELNIMQNGMNILGYIVFRILESKYPHHTFSDPLQFQDISAAVCVQGLNDSSWLPTLQRLLDHKKILVVQVQDAVDFCLETYKSEMLPEVEEPPTVDSRSYKTVKESKLSRSVKLKHEPLIDESSPHDAEIQNIDEIIQTPKLFPSEQPVLSKAAELGKIANEELNQGRPLTDFLIIDIIKEYLRSKTEQIRGWVFINYPDNFDQAAILEEALTGRQIPGVSPKVWNCRSIVEIRELDVEPEDRVWDEYEIFRQSKLVDNPKQNSTEQYYESMLTAFIRVIQTNTDNINQESGEVTLKNSEPSDTINPLDRFYSDQGCLYSVYYQVFDFNTLKHLAKIIIGDYSVPPKTSLELFGDTIKYLHADYTDMSKLSVLKTAKKGEKKEKPKEKVIKIHGGSDDHDVEEAVEAGSIKKKTGAPIQPSTIIVREDESTQVPEVEYEYIDTVDQVFKPGSAEWEYVSIKIPEDLEIILADEWEKLEQVYVEDFGQFFFMRRCLTNGVLPYVKQVKTYLDQIFSRPDNMQTTLRQFQQIYNEFDDDVRNDEEFKAELHCRVHEMKDKLTDICDSMMTESENERRALISKNWAPTQLIELFNCYVEAFQLEINRCVDTIVFADDYYTSMINNVPASEQVVAKERLQRLDVDDSNLIKNTNDMLVQVETFHTNPFYQKAEDFLKKMSSMVTKIGHTATERLETMSDIFLVNNEGASGAKPKTGGKKDKKSDKGDNHPKKTCEPNKVLKKNIQKILDEWKTLINGEISRVNIHLKLLKSDLISSLDGAVNLLKTTFSSAYDDIKTKYRTRMESIGRACDLLFSAIEEEVKIQEEMVFKDGFFYVDPSVVLFKTAVTAPEPEHKESFNDFTFTVEQLNRLASTLLSLAPSGVIALRSLTFLLADMLVADDLSLVPKMWTKMDVSQLENLVWNLFGAVELVTWKDFILWNLTIPFPDEQEILDARRKCLVFDRRFTEVVSREDFYKTQLWFEGKENDECTVDSIKKLLFTLYAINPEELNYTALLLDFCKSKILPKALGKALALALGNKVCWDKEKGHAYVEDTLEKRRNQEEKQKYEEEEKIKTHGQDSEHDEITFKSKHFTDHEGDEEHFGESPDGTEDKNLDVSVINTTKSSRIKSSGSELTSISIKTKGSRTKSESFKFKKSTMSNKSSVARFEAKTENGKGKLIGATTCKASKISRKTTKDFLVKLPHEIVEDAMDKASLEQATTEEDLCPEETDTEIQDISFELKQHSLEYFIDLDTIQEILNCAVTELMKTPSTNEKSFHELVEDYFNECRREDFNDQVLVHELLNKPKFLELVGRTSKFRICNPPQVVEELLKDGK